MSDFGAKKCVWNTRRYGTVDGVCEEDTRSNHSHHPRIISTPPPRWHEWDVMLWRIQISWGKWKCCTCWSDPKCVTTRIFELWSGTINSLFCNFIPGTGAVYCQFMDMLFPGECLLLSSQIKSRTSLCDNFRISKFCMWPTRKTISVVLQRRKRSSWSRRLFFFDQYG